MNLADQKSFFKYNIIKKILLIVLYLIRFLNQ
jgi:hypothetical protein